MPEHFYRVDEANALIPKLRPLLERIRATRAELAADKTVALVKEKAAHNGGGQPGNRQRDPAVQLHSHAPLIALTLLS